MNRSNHQPVTGAETVQGNAWINKYMHPPVLTDPLYAGIPDNNNAPIVIMEHTAINNIPLVIPSTPTPIYTSELLILQGSGAKVFAYVFIRGSYNIGEVTIGGAWVPHPTIPAIIYSNYNFGSSWANDIMCYRHGARSSTTYLNSTQFTNQGTSTVSQFRPNVTYRGPFAPFIQSLKRDDRARIADLIISQHLKNNRVPDHDDELMHEHILNTDFESLHSMYDFHIQIVNFASSVNDFTLAGVQTTLIAHGLVVDPTQLQNLSPKAVTELASEGTFVVQHWSQSTNDFKNNPSVSSSIPGNTNLPQCFYSWYQPVPGGLSALLVLEPLYDSAGSNYDTTWTDLTWAFQYYSGLSVSSTVTSAFPPYITFKGKEIIEAQPQIASPFVPFIKPCPIPDNTAIRIAAGLAHQMPDSLPASANMFGSFLPLLAQFVPTALSWVKTLFSSGVTQKIADVATSIGVAGDAIKQSRKAVKPTIKPSQKVAFSKDLALIRQRLAKIEVKPNSNAKNIFQRVLRSSAAGGKNKFVRNAYRFENNVPRNTLVQNQPSRIMNVELPNTSVNNRGPSDAGFGFNRGMSARRGNSIGRFNQRNY